MTTINELRKANKVKKKPLEDVSDTTPYIVMKRCLNCFHTTEADSSRCSQCGYLFLGEATGEQKDEANKRLIKLKEKVKGDEEDGTRS